MSTVSCTFNCEIALENQQNLCVGFLPATECTTFFQRPAQKSPADPSACSSLLTVIKPLCLQPAQWFRHAYADEDASDDYAYLDFAITFVILATLTISHWHWHWHWCCQAGVQP